MSEKKMIPSANSRRKVLILASSPGKSRVLAVKDREGKWNVPDSHKHWKIGKRFPPPLLAACTLLKEATLGILSSEELKADFMEFGKRKKLPSGGYIYAWKDTPTVNILESVDHANKVSKYLHLDHCLEMKNVTEIKSADSFSKYGPETIEAVRFLEFNVALT